MHAQLPRRMTRLLLVTVACFSAGCVKAYQAPLPNEPHAIVKVRRVFHSAPGAKRDVRVFIDDDLLLEQSSPSDPPRAETDVTRVRPGASRITIRTLFWHSESRLVTEIYDEQVPYTATETRWETENEPCSAGRSPPCTRQVSRTRTVTKFRTERKTRMVWRWVDVTDDACDRFVVPLFQNAGVYMLQFTYTGAGSCIITCLQQFAADTPEGSVLRPCTYPP